jgi:hypothetical protein
MWRCPEVKRQRGGPLDKFGRTFGGRPKKRKLLAMGTEYPFGGSDSIDHSYFDPDFKRKRL